MECLESQVIPCPVNRQMWDQIHDDVIEWKHFPPYWPFVRGIHRSPVNSPHKGQWREALMFSLICAWVSGWVNNVKAGDLRRHHAHYDVIVMYFAKLLQAQSWANMCPVHMYTRDWHLNSSTSPKQCSVHYNDVIKSAMASQITSVSTVRSTVGSGPHKKVKSPRHWSLCGNSPVSCEFPAQKASKAENVNIFDDVIMISLLRDTNCIPITWSRSLRFGSNSVFDVFRVISAPSRSHLSLDHGVTKSIHLVTW